MLRTLMRKLTGRSDVPDVNNCIIHMNLFGLNLPPDDSKITVHGAREAIAELKEMWPQGYGYHVSYYGWGDIDCCIKTADEIFKVLQGEVDNFFRLNGDMFKSKEFQDAWKELERQQPTKKQEPEECSVTLDLSPAKNMSFVMFRAE